MREALTLSQTRSGPTSEAEPSPQELERVLAFLSIVAHLRGSTGRNLTGIARVERDHEPEMVRSDAHVRVRDCSVVGNGVAL